MGGKSAPKSEGTQAKKILRTDIEPRPTQDTGGTPGSEQIEPPVQDTEMAAVMPQAGGGVPGGTGASQQSYVIKAPQGPEFDIVYNKAFQLYTAGFQFTNVNEAFIEPPNIRWECFRNCGKFTTPLACINPSAKEIYMTQREFQEMPSGAYATRCEVKVTPVGYRLPFATNEAASSYANSQTLVQIGSAVGINKVMNGFIAAYTSDPGDLTLPTGNPNTSIPRYENILYGNEQAIGTQVGIPRHWNRYWMMVNNTASKRCPNLSQFVKIQNINDVKGTPVVNFEYNFKNGLLKDPETNPIDTAAPGENKNYGLPEGKVPQLFFLRRQDNKTTVLQQLNGMIYNYETEIERCSFQTRHAGQTVSSDAVPLVYFGVYPVQKNAALSPTPEFADVVVQWCIETKLYVKVNQNLLHPNLDVRSINSYDPVHMTGDATQLDYLGGTRFAYICGRHVWSAEPSGTFKWAQPTFYDAQPKELTEEEERPPEKTPKRIFNKK